MKRLLKYDAIIAATALAIWVALVLVEVKFRELWFFRYVFLASLVMLLVAFPTAGALAFEDNPKAMALAVIASLVLAPIFIVVGVMLVGQLKLGLLGGTGWHL